MNKLYELGMYEKAVPKDLSWEEKLTAAKAAGYDYIEMSIDESDEKLKRLDWSEAQIAELRGLETKIGMPIRSICLSGHRKYPLGAPDPSVRKRSMEIMEKALILADKLGIRTIQLAGYDVYYEESTEESRMLFEENLKKASDMAAKYGVTMGFETMETPFMNTVEKAMKYVKLVDSPYLNVYPDLGNITNAAVTYGRKVCDDLETGRGRLIAMHLKETKPGLFREIPFGTGHVDFDSGIAKALDLGVRRFVTEMWYTGSPEWKKDLDFAVSMLSSKIDKQLEERMR